VIQLVTNAAVIKLIFVVADFDDIFDDEKLDWMAENPATLSFTLNVHLSDFFYYRKWLPKYCTHF